MSRPRRPRGPFRCPHCDALVPARAPACPECGSDADSGWSEDAGAWAGELPTGWGEDGDFDYEEALRAEGLGDDPRPAREALRRRRVALVCLLLVACALLWLAWRGG